MSRFTVPSTALVEIRRPARLSIVDQSGFVLTNVPRQTTQMSDRHMDAPMQVGHDFLRSIEQLEQPIDGFFELRTSTGPQVPTQIIEPVIELEHRPAG